MTDTYADPQPSLGSYLAVLRRRKWWMILVTVLVTAGALGYSLSQPKSYSASAQLLVETPGAQGAATTNTQAITPTQVLTELQLVTSAPVKSTVARKLGSVPDITAAEVGQTNVISVSATAASPARAASIANAYSTAFVAYEQSVNLRNLKAVETKLSGQISSIDAEAKALQSRTTTAVTPLLRRATVLKRRLKHLQVTGALNNGSSIKNLTAAETNLSQQIVSLDDEAAALPSKPASSAAEKTALLNQATVLRGQLTQLGVERSVDNTDLAAAETSLSHEISSLDAEVNAIMSDPASSTEVAALLSQSPVLKGQLAQMEVNGAVNAGGVELVTPASAPSAPSSPKPLRDALLGLVLGLLLGIGLAFVVEHSDDALYLSEEVERLTGGARVLALVPMVNSWKNRDRAVLVTKTEPRSPAGEAYLSLRTSLQFATLSSNARVLLVTSPSEKEGKSSTVANLGVVLALAAQRVVIVSCDLRRPRIGQFFGLDEQQMGIASVLLGQCSLEEAIQPVPGVSGLSILGTGELTTDPTSVLAHDELSPMLDKLSEMFDLVLVDSPPLLPVTDAAILAQMVDATLLVVAAGQTRRRDLNRALEALSLVNATLIGVVLNEVTRSAGSGYGYGKYSQYGSYTTIAPSTNGNGSHPVGTAEPVGATAGVKDPEGGG